MESDDSPLASQKAKQVDSGANRLPNASSKPGHQCVNRRLGSDATDATDFRGGLAHDEETPAISPSVLPEAGTTQISSAILGVQIARNGAAQAAGDATKLRRSTYSNTVTQPKRRKRRDSSAMPFAVLQSASRATTPTYSRRVSVASKEEMQPERAWSARAAGLLIVRGEHVGDWRDRMAFGSTRRLASKEASQLLLLEGARGDARLRALRPPPLPPAALGRPGEPLPPVRKEWLMDDCRRWPRHLQSLGVFAHPVGAWCLRASSPCHRRACLARFQAQPSDFLRLMGRGPTGAADLHPAAALGQEGMGLPPASGAGADSPGGAIRRSTTAVLDASAENRATGGGRVAYSRLQSALSPQTVASVRAFMRLLRFVRGGLRSAEKLSPEQLARKVMIKFVRRMRRRKRRQERDRQMEMERRGSAATGGAGASESKEGGNMGGVLEDEARPGLGGDASEQEGEADGQGLRLGLEQGEDPTEQRLRAQFERHGLAEELARHQGGSGLSSGAASTDSPGELAVDELEARLAGMLADQATASGYGQVAVGRQGGLLHGTGGGAGGNPLVLQAAAIGASSTVTLLTAAGDRLLDVARAGQAQLRWEQEPGGGHVDVLLDDLGPYQDPRVVSAARVFGGIRQGPSELVALRGTEGGMEREEGPSEQVQATLQMLGQLAQATRAAAAAVAGYRSFGAMARASDQLQRASYSGEETLGTTSPGPGDDPLCIQLLAGGSWRQGTSRAGAGMGEGGAAGEPHAFAFSPGVSVPGLDSRGSSPSREASLAAEAELRLQQREAALRQREEDLRGKEKEAEQRIARALLHEQRELLRAKEEAQQQTQRLRDRTVEVEREAAAELQRRLAAAEAALVTAEEAEREAGERLRLREQRVSSIEASLGPRERAVETGEKRLLSRWKQARDDIARQLAMLEAAETRLAGGSVGGGTRQRDTGRETALPAMPMGRSPPESPGAGSTAGQAGAGSQPASPMQLKAALRQSASPLGSSRGSTSPGSTSAPGLALVPTGRSPRRRAPKAPRSPGLQALGPSLGMPEEEAVELAPAPAPSPDHEPEHSSTSAPGGPSLSGRHNGIESRLMVASSAHYAASYILGMQPAYPRSEAEKASGVAMAVRLAQTVAGPATDGLTERDIGRRAHEGPRSRHAMRSVVRAPQRGAATTEPAREYGPVITDGASSRAGPSNTAVRLGAGGIWGNRS